MLSNSKAFSGFSVNNLEQAKQFYEEVLGLEVNETPMNILEMHLDGGTHLILYPKPNHEPATYTVLNFPVDDLEATVDELTKRGVKFEQYTGYIQTDEKGIFKSGNNMPDHAWFKDPAGNLLTVLKQKQ